VTLTTLTQRTTASQQAAYAAAAVDAVLADPACLRLVVQPLVNLADGEVVGYEALSRVSSGWRVPPEALFAAAARRGDCGALAELVLRQALGLRDRLPDRSFLSVNLSPIELATPEVRSFLSSADMSRLVVELTESAWPDDDAAVLHALELLRGRGGLVAVDDVGAGYSALFQLVRVRPQFVKVDRSLVARLEFDPAAEAVLRMLGELASVLDAWVLAEGVETAAQLAIVARLGVPLAQGYYLGRPAPPWPPGDNLAAVRRAEFLAATGDALLAHARAAAPGEVECDAWGRPQRIRVDGGSAREPIWVPATTLAPSTPPKQALRRALTRPDPLARFSPLCVTDHGGRLVALVPVDALALALGDGASAAAVATDAASR